jgi:hypothetical protein
MGGFLTTLKELNVFHECIYYVLNDCACHSDCQEYCTLDCETHQVTEEQPEYNVQTDCCFIKDDATSESSESR